MDDAFNVKKSVLFRNHINTPFFGYDSEKGSVL